jgi:hypothetical protein
VRAARPLARETSAGGARRVGWSLGSSRRQMPLVVARPREMERRRATPPGSGGRHGGWGQSHPEVSSHPSASWGRRVDETGAGIGRSRGCARGLFWLQKSTRGTGSKSVFARARETGSASVGSSLPAACSGGERVLEAGSRRQSREHGGGLSMILRFGVATRRKSGERAGGGESHEAGELERARRSAEERALVEGRRPGIDEAAVFDEAAVEAVSGGLPGAGPAARQAWARAGSRQRASEVTSQARLAVDNAAVGRCSAEGLFDRSSARTARRHAHHAIRETARKLGRGRDGLWQG